MNTDKATTKVHDTKKKWEMHWISHKLFNKIKQYEKQLKKILKVFQYSKNNS